MILFALALVFPAIRRERRARVLADGDDQLSPAVRPGRKVLTGDGANPPRDLTASKKSADALELPLKKSGKPADDPPDADKSAGEAVTLSRQKRAAKKAAIDEDPGEKAPSDGTPKKAAQKAAEQSSEKAVSEDSDKKDVTGETLKKATDEGSTGRTRISASDDTAKATTDDESGKKATSTVTDEAPKKATDADSDKKTATGTTDEAPKTAADSDKKTSTGTTDEAPKKVTDADSDKKTATGTTDEAPKKAEDGSDKKASADDNPQKVADDSPAKPVTEDNAKVPDGAGANANKGDDDTSAPKKRFIPRDQFHVGKNSDMERLLRNKQGPQSRRALMETVQNVLSKVVGLVIVVGAVGIIGMLLGGLFLHQKRRSGPRQETLQADTPLLETEEFY